MKRLRGHSIFMGLVFALCANTGQARVQSKDQKEKKTVQVEFRPGEFLVKMKSASSVGTLSQEVWLKNQGLSVKDVVNAGEGVVLVKKAGPSVQSLSLEQTMALAAELQKNDRILHAEPNFVYRAFDEVTPASEPNDPRFKDLWGMKNTGQADGQGYRGVEGSDIKAASAWAMGVGSREIVVAIIDTGVDFTHPDLKDNIWSKPGQPNVHGYNAIDKSNNSMDDNSHGTHCSGTIGAVGDNGIGVAGVNWKVRLMGVKFLGSDGSGDTAGAIRAIDWAVENGAQILSNSWGGGGYSELLEESIKRAADKGILFVAAAGNDARNNDATKTYPAGYEVSNIVAVAASNNRDELADFSNYGGRTVHLMAPGDGILSTVPGGDYKVYSGTSMACPHVAGAAALLLSREPSLTPTQVRERLMSSADKFPSMRRRLISGGRLNLYNLVANITPPGFVEIPDSAWSAPIAQEIRTEHPYVGKTSQKWVIEKKGATYLRVRFAKFETESRYDTVRLIAGDTGELVETYTGELPDNFWTVEVPGSKLILEFNTDDSVHKYGFDIDAYSWTTYTGSL